MAEFYSTAYKTFKRIIKYHYYYYRIFVILHNTKTFIQSKKQNNRTTELKHQSRYYFTSSSFVHPCKNFIYPVKKPFCYWMLDFKFVTEEAKKVETSKKIA